MSTCHKRPYAWYCVINVLLSIALVCLLGSAITHKDVLENRNCNEQVAMQQDPGQICAKIGGISQPDTQIWPMDGCSSALLSAFGRSSSLAPYLLYLCILDIAA